MACIPLAVIATTFWIRVYEARSAHAHKPHHQRQPSLSLSIPGLLEVSGWFAELDAEAQARVLDEMREQHVAAGAALCRRGETPLHWYGMLEGLLKWSITSDDGRTVTFGGQSVGSWFGEGTLLRAVPRQATSWRCATAGSRCSRSTPSTGCAARAELQRLPADADQRAHALVHGQLCGAGPAGHRQPGGPGDHGLVHPLLNPRGERHLETSQEEIANLAGLSRQRCNAALNRLRAAGLLQIEYGGITVVDLEGLRRFVDQI